MPRFKCHGFNFIWIRIVELEMNGDFTPACKWAKLFNETNDATNTNNINISFIGLLTELVHVFELSDIEDVQYKN